MATWTCSTSWPSSTPSTPGMAAPIVIRTACWTSSTSSASPTPSTPGAEGRGRRYACGMSGRIVLIGGGGHALVVAEAARLAGMDIAGFLDDASDAALAESVQRLGGLSDLASAGGAGLILAVGG